ncbi:unnamed protein product [Heligmosomoides polygyrus]|uniref:Endo/exonuclease/phosphatase domain-containing protein n=1 Tax=Heligmosomoides polygyrus TaxID=6339 RepID=A0A183GI33_HELPZ|nr:unnamed protein product [Heligmosomoides polygyrus]
MPVPPRSATGNCLLLRAESKNAECRPQVLVTVRPTNILCYIIWLMMPKSFGDNATAFAEADAHSQSTARVKSVRESFMRGRHRGPTELVPKSRNVGMNREATLNVGTLTDRSCELVEALERTKIDFCAVQETKYSY